MWSLIFFLLLFAVIWVSMKWIFRTVFTGTSFEAWRTLLRGSGKYLPWIVLFFVIVSMLQGLYFVVPAGSRGVTLRLGVVSSVVDEGLRFKIPIIDDIRIVNIETIRRYEFGYKTINPGPPASYEDEASESKMLTEDHKIIKIDWVLQFQVGDPVAYILNIPDEESDGEKLIRDISEAVFRETVAGETLDDILTVGKERLQSDARIAIQKQLDALNLGIRITAVQLQDIEPPESVRAAFSEVNSARAEKDRLQLEAEQYANEILPKSEGEAKTLLNDAEAYKFRRIETAKGEAARILALADSFKRNPSLVKANLWLETMRDVWPKLNPIIVDRGVNPVLMFSPDGFAGLFEAGSGRGK